MEKMEENGHTCKGPFNVDKRRVYLYINVHKHRCRHTNSYVF